MRKFGKKSSLLTKVSQQSSEDENISNDEEEGKSVIKREKMVQLGK